MKIEANNRLLLNMLILLCISITFLVLCSSFVLAITNCGVTINGSTTLTQSISGSGTCIRINNNSLTLDCAGYTITGNGAGILINSSGKTGIVIANCTLNNTLYGIFMDNSNDSVVKNNIIQGLGFFGYGLEGRRLRNISFVNNTVKSGTFGLAGFFFKTNNINLWFYNNTLNGSNSALITGIIMQNTNNSVMNGNTVISVDNTAFGVYNAFNVNITSNTATDSQGSTGTTKMIDVDRSVNTLVRDNSFLRGHSDTNGLEVYAANDTYIINNTLVGFDIGIYVYYKYCNNTLIENNSLKNMNYSVIRVEYANNTVIRNNTIQDGSQGVFLIDSSEAVIENNRILNCSNKTRSPNRDTAAGVRIQSNTTLLQNTRILNNTFRNNEHGILVWQNAYITTIANNTFENNSFGGILGLHGQATRILDNNIFRNNGNNNEFMANIFEAREIHGELAVAAEEDNYYVTIPVNTKVMAWVESAGDGVQTGMIKLNVSNSAHSNVVSEISNTLIQTWIEAVIFKTNNEDTFNFSVNLANTTVYLSNGTSVTGAIPANYTLFIAPILKASIQLAREQDGVIQNITTNDSIGIWLLNSTGTQISNITYEVTPASAGLYLINSRNTSLWNTTIKYPFFIQELAYGSINFSADIAVPDEKNLLNILNITQNMIYADTLTAPEFNKSAILTFKNLTLNNPRSIVDLDDNGGFDFCEDCSEISYSGGTFIYNVQHFTHYSSDETPILLSGGSSGGGRFIPGGVIRSPLQNISSSTTLVANKTKVSNNVSAASAKADVSIVKSVSKNQSNIQERAIPSAVPERRTVVELGEKKRSYMLYYGAGLVAGVLLIIGVIFLIIVNKK